MAEVTTLHYERTFNVAKYESAKFGYTVDICDQDDVRVVMQRLIFTAERDAGHWQRDWRQVEDKMMAVREKIGALDVDSITGPSKESMLTNLNSELDDLCKMKFDLEMYPPFTMTDIGEPEDDESSSLEGGNETRTEAGVSSPGSGYGGDG